MEHKKLDIVEMIKGFYMKKGSLKSYETEPLVPTKAALFGLDLRFREADQQVYSKKIRKAKNIQID